MEKKEEFLRMVRDSGTLTTGSKSFSFDEETKYIKDYFGISGTKLLRNYFIEKLKLKTEKELEEFIWTKLLKEIKIKNFSEDFRKIINNYFIKICENEIKNTENYNTKEQLKNFIKRKKEYIKKGEYKRGQYGKI